MWQKRQAVRAMLELLDFKHAMGVRGTIPDYFASLSVLPLITYSAAMLP